MKHWHLVPVLASLARAAAGDLPDSHHLAQAAFTEKQNKIHGMFAHAVAHNTSLPLSFRLGSGAGGSVTDLPDEAGEGEDGSRLAGLPGADIEEAYPRVAAPTDSEPADELVEAIVVDDVLQASIKVPVQQWELQNQRTSSG